MTFCWNFIYYYSLRNVISENVWPFGTIIQRFLNFFQANLVKNKISQNYPIFYFYIHTIFHNCFYFFCLLFFIFKTEKCEIIIPSIKLFLLLSCIPFEWLISECILWRFRGPLSVKYLLKPLNIYYSIIYTKLHSPFLIVLFMFLFRNWCMLSLSFTNSKFKRAK